MTKLSTAVAHALALRQLPDLAPCEQVNHTLAQLVNAVVDPASEHEAFEANTTKEIQQIAAEAEELREVPNEERAELELIYRSKGFTEDEARTIAERVMADPDTALSTLAREELGIDPAELGGNPWSAAGVSLLLFALGAIFPVAPFLWLENSVGIVASIALSLFGLGAVGAVTSLFNGRSFAYSASRQILFGGAAAAVTFGVGILFGATIA